MGLGRPAVLLGPQVHLVALGKIRRMGRARNLFPYHYIPDIFLFLEKGFAEGYMGCPDLLALLPRNRFPGFVWSNLSRRNTNSVFLLP